jgi:hypothetical protein
MQTCGQDPATRANSGLGEDTGPVTIPARKIDAGSRLACRTYQAVGSRQRVASTSAELRLSEQPAGLGPLMPVNGVQLWRQL